MKTLLYRLTTLAFTFCIAFGSIATAQDDEVKELQEKLREQSRELAETARELRQKQRENLSERELICRTEIERLAQDARRIVGEQRRFLKEELMLGDIWNHHIIGGHPPITSLFIHGDSASHRFTNRGAEAEKTKTFTKTYKVRGTDKLDIINKFGKVHVNTWAKNEIAVEVVMIARADNDEKAQRLLDRINIRESVSPGTIALRTEFETEGNVKGRSGFEINYTVSMPKDNPLLVKNSFGDVYVAEINGPVNLDVKYGSLKTGRLNNVQNQVKVAFGSGDLAYVNKGDLDISYSKFNLGGSEEVEIDNAFSDLVVGNSRNMQLQSKYGSVKIDKVDILEGAIGFSGFKLNKLGNKMDLNVKYCPDFQIDEVGKDFKSIDLDGSFSTFDLRFAGNTGFSFDTEMSFGDLNVNKGLVQFNQVEKQNTSNSYKGTYGKKPGSSNVRIATKYSNVKFRSAE
jgi:hypothetical protein